jgi:hypothetical protein
MKATGKGHSLDDGQPDVGAACNKDIGSNHNQSSVSVFALRMGIRVRRLAVSRSCENDFFAIRNEVR